MLAHGIKASSDSERPQDQFETGSQDDDDGLLGVRISTVSARRPFTDGGNRSSYPRAHLRHYSTTTRYVVIRSLISRVNNTLEPPSPESCANSSSLVQHPPAPGSSPAKLHFSPGPPMIPSVEMPDPKPTSDNPASTGDSHRTIGEWMRTVMTKRSRGRTPRQMRPEAPPLSGIPSQTKATSPGERPSTMSPGKRQPVSVPFSTDTEHEFLTAWLSGRLEGPLLENRHVHVSYLFTNIIAYCASQKKAALKPTASSRPPKTTPHSGVGPADVPDETKTEHSGAQNNGEVRFDFVRFAAGIHTKSRSQVDHSRPHHSRPLRSQQLPTKRKLRLLARKTT